MLLMIFQFCFLFGITSETFTCVGSSELAKVELERRSYEHLLYVPGPFENGYPFLKFMEANYPETKVEGVNLWCRAALQ